MSTSKDDGDWNYYNNNDLYVKMKPRAETCSKANMRIYIYAVFIDVRERSFTHHRNYMHATYHHYICDSIMLAAAYVNIMKNRM
jgi:hypothetical protein